ncbi:hypothetical protein ABID22_001638 [Pontibacter aydingkolensis]|uniref:Uncharacterized protein n=1 Tax=Pontibacter aydingkolensis TaxID=1911536 RepID=A0ABS7CTX0_9BACT|nr:hypothetical protein [Pontibacter aydingkolensis]MBW7467305.1 hypothetical protein [Pontibacter aydingkolensis]
MMEDKFDFDKVGKRMPYKVPQDFFDKITESTLAEAERRNNVTKQPKLLLWRALSVAASLVILFTVGYFMYTNRTAPKENIIAAAQQDTLQNTPVVNGDLPETRELPNQETTTAKARPEKPTIATAPKTPAPAESQQPIQLAKTDRPETLDDVLASITDEELFLLAAKAETGLVTYEQTITDEQTF